MHDGRNTEPQSTYTNKAQNESTSQNILTYRQYRNNNVKKRKHKLQRIRRLRRKTYRKERIEIARTYIKNLSKYTLSDSEILVLSKNLKFVPTPAPPRTRELIKDFDDLARRMRSRLWAFENKVKPKQELFTTRKQVKHDAPSDNATLENYLTATKIELANLHSSKRYNRENMLKTAVQNIYQNKRFHHRIKGNFNSKLKTVLRKLQKNNNIIIKKSDKGNCTVVIDREQYIKEGKRQLNSCAHYIQIEDDVTNNVSKLVHDTLIQLWRKGEINDKTLEYLSPIGDKKTKTAELYLLNKIHSDPPTKARPIISANNCPVERISEYVDFFLQPFVIKQHTYIKDTSDFIRKIEKIKVPNEALIIVLDYESMYTNIVHDEAINAVYNTLSNDHMHQNINGIKRPSIDAFCQLVELAVKCNNFNFNGEHFYQCRGVAMGHVASPTICDIVIFYLEQRILALSNDKIYKWLRFRDDVFALYLGNLEEATVFLTKANDIHPTLKFKYEISTSQGTFLDTIVFKGKRFQQENILDFKPYVKPSEKFQYIHRQSSHPKSVFGGLIKGELIRFVRTSTNKEDYTQRATLFREKLLLRGYTDREFKCAFNSVHHNQREKYLEVKAKTNQGKTPLVFTTTYNPHLKGFSRAITRNWELISQNKKLNNIFPKKPLIAYRRGKNLKDYLVRAKLKPLGDTENKREDDLDTLIGLLEKDPDACISTIS